MADYFDSTLAEEQYAQTVGLVDLMYLEYSTDTVIVFVEGKDDCIFYAPIINKITPESEVEFIICGNKESLLNTQREVHSYKLAVDPKAMLFFCDTDFDLLRGIEPISSVHYTEYYSIESYIGEESYIYRSIDIVLSSLKADKRKLIKSEFCRMSKECHKKLRRGMILLAIIREIYPYVDLDLVTCDDIIEISGSTINFRPKWASNIKRKLDIKLDCESKHRFRELLKKSESLDPKLWIRGKHLLQLYRNIGNALNLRIGRLLNQKHSKSITSWAQCAFSRSALGNLLTYCEVPGHLMRYISRNV